MSKCWYCNNELTSGDSPKHFGICNKCYDEMFKSSDTIISSFTNKISDLEAKLAESESQNKRLYTEKESAEKILRMTSGEQTREILELKQQLAEKEEEIEELKLKLDIRAISLQNFNIERMQANQDKISFAVEQLEKVKNYMITDEKDMFGANYLMNSGYVLEFIDNQIKAIKGEK